MNFSKFKYKHFLLNSYQNPQVGAFLSGGRGYFPSSGEVDDRVFTQLKKPSTFVKGF